MSLSDGFLTFHLNVLIENESKKVELKVSDFSISTLFSVFSCFLLFEKNGCAGKIRTRARFVPWSTYTGTK